MLTKECLEAMKLVAEKEGLTLDPIYTDKAIFRVKATGRGPGGGSLLKGEEHRLPPYRGRAGGLRLPQVLLTFLWRPA